LQSAINKKKKIAMKQKILVSVIMFAAMGGCGGDNASSTGGTAGAAGIAETPPTTEDPSAEQVAVPLSLRGKTLTSEEVFYAPLVFATDSDTLSGVAKVDRSDSGYVREASYTWKVFLSSGTLDINVFEVSVESKRYEEHFVLNLTFIASDHGVLSGFGEGRWLDESGELISVTPYDIPQSSFTLQ
jgi:hypothetical protein